MQHISVATFICFTILQKSNDKVFLRPFRVDGDKVKCKYYPNNDKGNGQLLMFLAAMDCKIISNWHMRTS